MKMIWTYLWWTMLLIALPFLMVAVLLVGLIEILLWQESTCQCDHCKFDGYVVTGQKRQRRFFAKKVAHF